MKYFLSSYAKLSEGVEVFTELDFPNTESRVNHRIKENGMKQLSEVLMGFTLHLLNMQEARCLAGVRRNYLAMRRFWYIIFKNKLLYCLFKIQYDDLFYKVS